MMYRLGILACVASLAAGCGKTTCDTADFECIMDNSTFELNGQTVRPVKLPASRVPAPAPSSTGGTAPSKSALSLSIIPVSAPNFGDPIQMIQAGKVSAPGGGASGLPAAEITMPPSNVMLSESQPVTTMSIGYTDPYGMTPSFIFLPNILLPKIGTPVCWAFPPLRDLQIQGIAKIKIDATNVQMTPVNPSYPSPTVVMPTPIEPTPIGPSDIRPSVITATPVVSWFQPPLDPNGNGNGNGNGGGPGIGTYTACNGTPISCNANSPPQCGSSQECCNSNAECIICVPDCTNPINMWGPCYASTCTAQVMAAVSFCCPPPPP